MNSLVVVPSRLWEYCIAAIIIILAPGPSVLFVIARAIAWGRATAVETLAQSCKVQIWHLSRYSYLVAVILFT
jgi:threonine/homoserine/homoserine lactone efflux protein